MKGNDRDQVWRVIDHSLHAYSCTRASRGSGMLRIPSRIYLGELAVAN